MIGSNNVYEENADADDISKAIIKVATSIRKKQPDAHIIALV